MARLRHAPFQPPRLNTKWSGNALGWLADCRASGLACCLSTGSGSRSGTVLVPAGLRLAQILHRSTTLNRPTSTASPRVREKRERKKKKKEPCQFCLFTLHCSALVVSLRRQLAGHFHFISPTASSSLDPKLLLAALSPATLQYLQYTTVPLLLLSTHLIFTSHQISSLFTISYLPSRERAPNPDRPN